MLAVRTIVHPTDFSEQSQAAFGLACSLARDYGARLIVLHVVSAPTFVYGEGYLPPAEEELVTLARQQLSQIHAPEENVRVELLLEQGDVAREILRVAQETGADLIVMGTHGRTGLSRLLMGSVAEMVMRKALCPVLTVRLPFSETGPASRSTTQEPASV